MTKQSKQNFFKQVAEDYFEKREVSLENFCKMVQKVCPVFGTLKTEIKECDNSDKEITFSDEYIANMIISNKPIKNDNLEDIKETSTILQIILDSEGRIKFISHGIPFFTSANKGLVLFLGSLIDKKIIL